MATNSTCIIWNVLTQEWDSRTGFRISRKGRNWPWVVRRAGVKLCSFRTLEAASEWATDRLSAEQRGEWTMGGALA